MDNLNIKDLVKQHFNLVDPSDVETPDTEVTEAFAKIKTADGELEMEYDELAAGKPIFLITEDGKVPGPTGDYVLEGGKSVRIEDGIIAEVKEVKGVEAEEEEKLEKKEEDMSAETETEEVIEQEFEKKEEMDERTDAEEEGYKDGIKDAKEDIREAIDKIGLTDEQMGTLVASLADAVKDELKSLSAKVAAMEEKVEKMSVEPATEPTIVKSPNQPAETFSTWRGETSKDVDTRRQVLLSQIKNQ
jgi:flagellar biosynthesis/type III secretory pathway protein FliH